MQIERFGINQYRLVVDENAYRSVKNELIEDINRMQGKEFSDAELREKERQFTIILNSLFQERTAAQIIEEAAEILEMDTDAFRRNLDRRLHIQ